MTIEEYNVLDDCMKREVDLMCRISRCSIDKIKSVEENRDNSISYIIDNSENELAYYKKKVEEGDEFYRQFIN